MTYHLLGFFMGLFASIHCAIMCGPLLIAIQGNQKISWSQTLNKLLYQFGRILTYGVLGLLLGLVGNVASVLGWQQLFSLLTGAILLIIGFSYLFGGKSKKLVLLQTRAVQPFARLMGRWLHRPGGAFIAGVLNGILPCGMVYMALASAMNAENLVASFKFMLLFGAGTLPLMLLFSLTSQWTRSLIKLRFSNILPVFYFIMGMWFILRGSNLDIPYLSPLLYLDGAINCN